MSVLGEHGSTFDFFETWGEGRGYHDFMLHASWLAPMMTVSDVLYYAVLTVPCMCDGRCGNSFVAIMASRGGYESAMLC